ncbi:IclR family transcriptional regulator [Pseudohoeflea coraliihabitans]|uniref:IclR family transcriptional regulator n=1 Tax=Pseudohoeflea coraliihabitans TaxID=2860393 RepID=A0ABS6WSP1_9HYPH|nr:IclR family transcriptional regulator [Pseudohoeflea sp. DP4N28-3]MBW3098963.1 IclR family transcriptional regulator [Pseudohoeflea sp. DP4N28-3]
MTPDSKPSSFKQNIRAVSRAIAVLNSFAGKDAQTLAEVSAATGLDKGTTRRLLLTLVENNYIALDAANNQYRLGRAIRDLASNVSDSQDLRTLAQPALLELASELSVTVFLSVFKEGAAVCLARYHDMRGLEVHWWPVGGTLPLNCGGAPKLLLAYQPEEEIARLVSEPMQPLNENSIVSPDDLRQRLALIRERGFECAVDDVAIGITALAVPVLDADNKPICAVSIAGLTPQMIKNGEPVPLERLRQTARHIRGRLGL